MAQEVRLMNDESTASWELTNPKQESNGTGNYHSHNPKILIRRQASPCLSLRALGL
jgi:hypothetical protein